MKKFLKNSELIKKLENKIDKNFSFTKNSVKLFKKIGYQRLKEIINFMLDNNLIINNKTIKSNYGNEKHLRYTLMPRIETIEMILKKNSLHEITKFANGDDIFNIKPRIFIKKKLDKLLSTLDKNKSITNKLNGNSILTNNVSIYDWFKYVMFGELILFIKTLKPEIQKNIFKKSFSIIIKNKESNEIINDLHKIRKLRNKIAHSEHLFNNLDSSLKKNRNNIHNYPIAIREFISNSTLKSFFVKIKFKKIIDEYLARFEKYKK